MPKQVLLPKSILEKLPNLYETDGQGDAAVAQVKFFTPDSQWTWYATEFNPKTGVFFGLVVGFETELGYFSLQELQAATGPLGLPIERDEHFKPTALGEIKKQVAEARAC